MPYTKSAAISGLGSTLSIGTTPVLVAEIKNMAQSGRQATTVDVTNTQSTGKEFIPVIIDSGTWKIDGSYISGDAGQAALETAFATLAVTPFTIQLPKTASQTVSGDKFTFNALVQDINHSLGAEKEITVSITLKVSGSITLTPGS